MKNKIKYILFLSICMLGNYTTAKSVPIAKPITAPQTQMATVQNSLKIISNLSTVKLGETGVITIQGTPRKNYIIRTTYNVGNKTIPVMQLRTTDNTGVATFNWIVSMDSNPGTYNLSISGEGNTLNITHTVLP